jgi:hypothetical protein
MALGKIKTPFFGAPKKEKREKRRKGTPFFAVLSAGLGGRMWSLSTGLPS